MAKVYNLLLIMVALVLGFAFSAIPVEQAKVEYIDMAVRFSRFYEATIATLLLLSLIKYIMRD